VQLAAKRISSYVHRTPLIRSETLSDRFSTNIYLKLEVLQPTGAFKVRGAFNRMLTLTAEEQKRGVIAVSAGNHAQAVAYAASRLQLQSLILMPESTPVNYLERTRSYDDAEVILTSSLASAFEQVRHYEQAGWTYIHPFDDPFVIAGQGTIGLEIHAALPQVTDLMVSIGGGGLAAGVATSMKALKPDVRIWGCETIGADSMAQALRVGEVIELPAITSIARTLGAPAVSKTTLTLAQRYLEDAIVVSDEEALESLFELLEDCKVLTEPAASCTLAAAKKLHGNFTKDSHLVLVICGGNFALEDLCKMYDKLQFVVSD
jgi:threonine dehydratase